jgi:ABC-type glutathione transport system ATPase component
MGASPFILEVRGLYKTFTQGWWWQKKFQRRALANLNLALRRNKTLALVGESGCGKSTLAMCLVGLEKPDSGEILMDGTDLRSLDSTSASRRQKEIQLVFQDTASALNPRMSAIQIVEEPLLIRGQCSRKERWDLAAAMMERVGISPKWGHRRPHEFSGGQRQRLAIARALVLKPRVLILDEIFVGLDLSIRGQIANLLLDLQQTDGLSYICISHNLLFVSQIADMMAVMDQGQIVEHSSPQEWFSRARRSGSALRPAPSALAANATANGRP